MIRPAEVLRHAVIEAVPSIIISHNHPSQDPTPSPDDVAITRKLSQAANLLDIEFLDHVVIGGDRHVSLKDRGLMPLLLRPLHFSPCDGSGGWLRGLSERWPVPFAMSVLPDYGAAISFGLPFEPEDSQYGKSWLRHCRRCAGGRHGWAFGIDVLPHGVSVYAQFPGDPTDGQPLALRLLDRLPSRRLK